MADQAEDLRRLAQAQRAWRELTRDRDRDRDHDRRTAAATSKSQWTDYSDFFSDAAQAGRPDHPMNGGERVP